MLIPQIQPRPLSNMSVIQKTGDRIGKIIPNVVSRQFEMNKIGTLGRMSLLAVSLLFVLGARWYKSRDNHERREVLTRDGITVVAAMVAVPIVKNWMQRGIDAISKIPTATEKNKFFSLSDYGFDNLQNWYGKANLMPEKVLTMAKNITERKGDLVKAFSTLGDEGMKHIKTLLGNKELTSANILAALEKAKNSSDRTIKNAFESLTTILSKPDNNLVKSAQRLKAIPAIASLVGVIALLGVAIPAFNIYLTRKILKTGHDANIKKPHHHSVPNKIKIQNQTIIVNSKNLEPVFDNNQQVVINSFLLKNGK